MSRAAEMGLLLRSSARDGDQPPMRQGNSHPSLVPYQDFPTADGSMLPAIGNDGQFARFCAAVGHPEWSADPRFSRNTQRVAHRLALIPMMADVTRTRTTADWVAQLETCAVPCGPINDIGQAFNDPQVRARGLAVTLPRDGNDGIAANTTVASPIRLGDHPPAMRNAPPTLGQHTDEVLAELGVDAAETARLRRAGVI